MRIRVGRERGRAVPGGQPRASLSAVEGRLSPLSLDLFLATIQPCNSEGVWRPTGLGKAGAFHPLQHFIWRREALDRGGQIDIPAAHARNHISDAWQHVFLVDAVERAHRAPGLAKIQNATLS